MKYAYARYRKQPPFPRPPVYAAYFAEATKAKKASSFAKATADKTTGRPVRPNGSFRGLPQKANSLQPACMAIDKHISVQDMPYTELREELEAAKQIVRPEAWKKSPAPKKPSPK